MIATMLTLALVLAAQAPAAPAGDQAQLSKADADALIAGCAGRRFEAPVQVTVGGKVRRSKVKLCGKPGQSDADWARTLEDAVRNVEASPKMPSEARDQVIAALKAELAKLPKPAPAAAVVPLREAVPAPALRPPEYSSLPPLPPPSAVAPVARPLALKAASAPGPRPKLSFRCLTPGEGEGPCSTLERDSLLIVRADEDLGPGSRLRFLRRGDVRGEVALAPMARGKSVRLKLPKPVCSGVVRSQVEVQLVASGAAGTAFDAVGPLDLRC